jgi:hypothetical protein
MAIHLVRESAEPISASLNMTNLHRMFGFLGVVPTTSQPSKIPAATALNDEQLVGISGGSTAAKRPSPNIGVILAE